jgi:hypothetical protein
VRSHAKGTDPVGKVGATHGAIRKGDDTDIGLVPAAISAMVDLVLLRRGAGRLDLCAWAAQDGRRHLVRIRADNRDTSGVTVDFTTLHTHSAYSGRLSWDSVEDLKFIDGPPLPHSLPGRSGPVTWTAVCDEPPVARDSRGGSAVLARVGGRRKPLRVYVGAEPPREWTLRRA